MRRIHRRWGVAAAVSAIAVTLLLTVAPRGAVATGQDQSADEAAIRSLWMGVESALNDSDPAAMASFFLPDGDLIRYDGPRVVGREAIQAALEPRFAERSSTWRIAIRIENLRFIRPDVAVVDTIATFNEGEVRSNRGTTLLVREQDGWRIAMHRVFAAQGS